MKRIALACALMLASPLGAQTPPAPPADEGLTLMERGAQMLLRQFLNEVGPKLGEVQDGFEDALAALEPALRDLLDDDRRHPQLRAARAFAERRHSAAPQTRCAAACRCRCHPAKLLIFRL